MVLSNSQLLKGFGRRHEESAHIAKRSKMLWTQIHCLGQRFIANSLAMEEVGFVFLRSLQIN